MNGNHPVTGPAQGPSKRVIAALTAIGLGGIGLYFVGQSYPAGAEHFGMWSLVPPALAILLAFWLREVISALAIGILAGGLIAGQVNVIDAFLIPSIGTENYALILLVYLWALGGLIGIWTEPAAPPVSPNGLASGWSAAPAAPGFSPGAWGWSSTRGAPSQRF